LLFQGAFFLGVGIIVRAPSRRDDVLYRKGRRSVADFLGGYLIVMGLAFIIVELLP
jgi:hypothetical protein